MIVRSPKALAMCVINQRKDKKLTQANVGSLVGLKQATISAFENKADYTRLDTLFRILSAVGLDMKLVEKDANETHDISDIEW